MKQTDNETLVLEMADSRTVTAYVHGVLHPEARREVVAAMVREAALCPDGECTLMEVDPFGQ